jgi:protein-disulfide isomerase
VSKRADKKQAARVVREQLEREQRRRRAMWITIAAVIVLVVASLVGLVVTQSQKPASYTAPAGTTDDGGKQSGVIAAGTGPVTVEVYLDFLCPVCKQFETASGHTLDQLVVDNKIRLVWHTLGFLDQNSTTRYSTRSASAAGCASDAGKLKSFGEALFAGQPAEGGPGLSDDQLIEIGGNVGLVAPSFAQCVRDETYKSWVSHVNDLASQRGVNGTPTIYVNGKLLTDRSPAGITAAVNAAS